MARKRTTSRSRSSRRQSRSKKSPGRFKRFFRAFVASVLTSFSVASCVLHPQLREQLPLEPVLTQLGIPGYEPYAPLASASGALVQTRFAACPHLFPNEQPPAVPTGPALRELCFSSFAILHSGRTKTPVFVAQRLNRKMLAATTQISRTDRFYPEARLPAAERAELDDYRNSGYSRGHLAPAGDMHTVDAMAQSFSLANMVPQNQQHNAGPWNKIEQDTRKYIKRARGDVYVFTGPVYENVRATIGAGRVAVPTHLYKLVYDATTGKSWVHWQANSPRATATRPITYQEFVRRTGLRLLH